MDVSRRLQLDIIQGRPRNPQEKRVSGVQQRLNRPFDASANKLSLSERLKQWPLMIRRVMGHSMVPVLPPQTKVYGWRWFRKLKPGDVVIFKREGRETIKRVERFEFDRLFVLGDHVETSTDSRHFGAIPREQIEAKIIWPRAKKQPIY
jgi:hypothetical protein